MQNVDSNFITCLTSPSKWDELTGTIVLKDNVSMPIDLHDIVENSVSIMWDSSDGKKDISFGVSLCSELEISLFTTLDRYALEGAKFTVNYRVWNMMPEYEDGVLVNDAIYSDCPLGIFEALTVTKDTTANRAKILAYDGIKKLDQSIGSQVFGGRSWEILNEVCTKVGLPFDVTETELYAMFPNTNVALQFDETTGAKTYRDIVRYIGQLLGACFRVNRATGALELFKYSLTADYVLPRVQRKSYNPADYRCIYKGIQVTSVKGTYKSIRSSGIGMVMIIDDAPAWDYGTAEGLRATIDALGAYVKQIQYTPCKTTIFGNPMYDCGDRISLETDENSDNNVEILLTTVSWKFRNSTELESIGSNTLDIGIQQESDRQASRATDANKLVTYDVTNTNTITLHDQETTTICDVSFTSAQATHAMWLANILVDVDALTDFTDVKITYRYDGTEIPFYPQEHYTDGKHDFSLFFPISSIAEQSVHRWEVDITALNGTVTIDQYDFRGTLFGQNLVEQAEKWDGLLELEDIVNFITPITVISNLVESDVGVMLMDELRTLLADILPACTATIEQLITLAETCNIELKYREDICFCGEDYYCGTEGVLL